MSTRLRAGLALLLAGAAAACTPIRLHQGYVADPALITGIQPGVDNRESVVGTLGRPTFVGQFDQRDWYYVSRETRQLAFNRPRPTEQVILHVRFDEQGTVQSVERTGLERIVSIDPHPGRTPTLGRDRSLFEEIFGNIGAGGANRQGQTADNPQ